MIGAAHGALKASVSLALRHAPGASLVLDTLTLTFDAHSSYLLDTPDAKFALTSFNYLHIVPVLAQSLIIHSVTRSVRSTSDRLLSTAKSATTIYRPFICTYRIVRLIVHLRGAP